MSPTIGHRNPRTPLESAMVSALHLISARGYSECALREYSRVWRHLLVFASETGKREMSPKLGQEFLRLFRDTPAASRCRGRSPSIMEIRAVRALTYFVSQGVWNPCWERGRRRRQVPHVLLITECENASTPLQSAMMKALDVMKGLGYRESTLYRYGNIWTCLLAFAKQEGQIQMSTELGEQFLKAYEKAGRGVCTKHRVAIGRRAIRSLTHFVGTGVWKPVSSRRVAPVLVGSLRCELEPFLDYLKTERRVCATTLVNSERYIESFLTFLQDKSLGHLADLTPSVVTEFLAKKAYMSPRSLEAVSLAIRGFLRFHFVQGTVDRDWSSMIPQFRRHSDQLPPAIWTTSMVDSLLSSVDRSSPQGKRDYAMLLLGCRLGMRAGEIRMLRLESLRWDDARIEYVQSKTGVKVVFPLTEEIGHALIDYLLHGRPSTNRREVFLRLRAPFRPLAYSLSPIIKRYQQPHKMAFPGQHAGMQSLRHTLATQLLTNGIPLETIATILGHASSNTTRTYAKVDISQLRTAALDPEDVFHA